MRRKGEGRGAGEGPPKRSFHFPVLRDAALPLAFLGLFLAAPFLAFLALAEPAAAFGPWERARFAASAKLGALTALLALAFGLPLAALLGRYRFRGRRLLRALVTVPFVVPVVVMAGGLVALLGPGGLWERATGLRPRVMGTYAALLVAHAIYNVPIVVRLVGDAWAHLDPRPEQAAATLGAGPLARFARVTLPRLAPALAAAALLAFLFGFTAFGTVLLLADPVRDATLEAAVYHVGLRLFDLPTAAALALVQLASTVVVALAYTFVVGRVAARERAVPETETLRPLARRAWPLVAVALVVAAAMLLPLAAVVARAFLTPEGWGLGAFRRILGGEAEGFLVDPATALLNSARFAALTVLVAVPLGLLAARAAVRAPALDALWTAPLGASAVTLGLGLLLVFPWDLAGWRFDPRASWGLVLAAHVLVAFPFVVRALVGTLRARDPALGEAAATLGASRARRFLAVELPLLGPALLVAAVLAASTSLGEFAASLVLQRPGWATLPTEIYRHLATSRPDAWLFPEAMALATLLLAANVAAFLALERFRPGRSGGF